MFNADSKYQRQLLWLKRWIWVYFWLLIIEGALRKWVLTSLSGPLLLVRDPIALIVYVQAYRCRKLSSKTLWPMLPLAMVVLLLAGAQVVAGINTFLIALYGLRSYLLHLPLIFVMAETLEEEDLHRLGRWLMLVSVPMMVLILAQYNAPAGAWINAGAGENSSQIISAGGHIRPAGTFSYGIGMQGLVALCGAFIFDALLRKGRYPQWLLYSALFATVATIPLLGSRTVLFLTVTLVAFVLFAGFGKPTRFAGLVKIVAVLLLVGLIAIQLPFFNRGIYTMSERWQQASTAEGGVPDVLDKRVLGVFDAAVEATANAPLLGRGIGVGSNFAAVQMTGEEQFMLGENEWERVIYEMGPICGLLFMGMRFGFCIYLVRRALGALGRDAPLAWLLIPGVVSFILLMVMEQPTFLGFMAFGGGACLAAARNAERSTAFPYIHHLSNEVA